MQKPNREEAKPQTSQQSSKELSKEKDVLTDEEAAKVSGGIVSPRDAASGLPTGKRQH